MRGEAIGGDYVKSRSGKEHDARFFGVGIAGCKRFEDGNLAGNVEVMGLRANAGVGHDLGRMGKGAGAVRHDVAILKFLGDGLSGIEGEYTVIETEFAGLCDDLGCGTSGQNGAKNVFQGESSE